MFFLRERERSKVRIAFPHADSGIGSGWSHGFIALIDVKLRGFKMTSV